MLMVIENRDFIECVCKTRSEAEEYYSKHPSRETCRITEIESKRFPLFVTEIGYGNFKYFPTQKILVDFLRNLDMETLPKPKSVCSYIYDSGNCRTEEKIEPSINFYRFVGPFKSEEINSDYMGIIDHEHLNPEWVNTIIKYNSLRCVGMEKFLFRKMAIAAGKFFVKLQHWHVRCRKERRKLCL